MLIILSSKETIACVRTVAYVKSKEAEPGAWREKLRMVRFVGWFFP